MMHDRNHIPVECVIAKYKEDVGWTESLRRAGFKVTIYNKSGSGPHIPLPNIGRESHTYLHHIVQTYPEFADFTVFMQGDPFPHLARTGPDEPARYIAELAQRGLPFKGLSDFHLRFDGLGRPHDMRKESYRGKWAGWGKDIPVGNTYSQIFAGPVPESFHSRATCGLLFVSKERILLRPLGLYKKALALVEADPHDEENTGHAFERLWYLIFNGYAALNKENYEL